MSTLELIWGIIGTLYIFSACVVELGGFLSLSLSEHLLSSEQ